MTGEVERLIASLIIALFTLLSLPRLPSAVASLHQPGVHLKYRYIRPRIHRLFAYFQLTLVPSQGLACLGA
jgi:hypothetical protein